MAWAEGVGSVALAESVALAVAVTGHIIPNTAGARHIETGLRRTDLEAVPAVIRSPDVRPARVNKLAGRVGI